MIITVLFPTYEEFKNHLLRCNNEQCPLLLSHSLQVHQLLSLCRMTRVAMFMSDSFYFCINYNAIFQTFRLTKRRCHLVLAISADLSEGNPELINNFENVLGKTSNLVRLSSVKEIEPSSGGMHRIMSLESISSIFNVILDGRLKHLQTLIWKFPLSIIHRIRYSTFGENVVVLKVHTFGAPATSSPSFTWTSLQHLAIEAGMDSTGYASPIFRVLMNDSMPRLFSLQISGILHPSDVRGFLDNVKTTLRELAISPYEKFPIAIPAMPHLTRLKCTPKAIGCIQDRQSHVRHIVIIGEELSIHQTFIQKHDFARELDNALGRVSIRILFPRCRRIRLESVRLLDFYTSLWTKHEILVLRRLSYNLSGRGIFLCDADDVQIFPFGPLPDIHYVDVDCFNKL